MLTGVIVAIGIVNILGAGLPTLPREFRYTAQWLIGAGIGCTFDGAAIRQIRALLPIQALNILLLLLMSVVWAGLLWLLTPLDLLTALLATAPASAADMVATAIALGADPPVVAAIQALRVIFVSLTMPVLIRWALRRSNGHPSKELSPWK
jgi:membrane AbrB-like protein